MLPQLEKKALEEERKGAFGEDGADYLEMWRLYKKLHGIVESGVESLADIQLQLANAKENLSTDGLEGEDRAKAFEDLVYAMKARVAELHLLMRVFAEARGFLKDLSEMRGRDALVRGLLKDQSKRLVEVAASEIFDRLNQIKASADDGQNVSAQIEALATEGLANVFRTAATASLEATCKEAKIHA